MTDFAGQTPLFESPESAKTIELWSLVLQSVPLDHEIDHGTDGFYIWVREEDLSEARLQVLDFVEENRNWPPPDPPAAKFEEDDWGTLFVMLSLVLFFSVTGPWQGENQWFQVGAVDAEAIRESHQWWRLFTALTLHADAAHLLGNVFWGGLLLYYLGSLLGPGTALMAAVFTGGVGNMLNVYFHAEQHLSVGFSTSVFGIAGVFCGLRWLARGVSLQEILLPLGVLAALLAFLGSGGERTDLGAHFWGAVTGFVSGGILRIPRLRSMLQGGNVQFTLVLCCAVFFYLAWNRALASLVL